MKTEKILIGEIAMNDDRAEGGKGDIESLARNMDKYGQINAVTVVEDISNSYRYRIIAGRRRIAAAESLGWAEIRADVYEADEISEGSEEMIALSENAAREEMNAIDEGILYANELKKGTPVEELAALFCRNKSTVYQRSKLASLIPEMRELYKNGFMSLHIAAMAAALPEEAQKKIVEKYGDNHGRGIYEWEIKNVVSEVSQDFIDRLGKCEACAVCSKRTRYSDKTLFPELAESNDRCLDHECFCKKFAERLEQAFNEFSERSKGATELDCWDGKRIVTTENIPDGMKVLDITLGNIADDEDDITEVQNEEDAEIKEKLEAAGKVDYVPCWNGTEFSFIELAKREDVDALYFGDGKEKSTDNESEWQKQRREKLSDIFSSFSEEKRSEIISDTSNYGLESEVRNLFLQKVADAFQPENCNTAELLILAAQLTLSNTEMRKFLSDDGITNEDVSQSFAVFEKLQRVGAKSICIALIKSRLAGYGPKPEIYGIEGSDWEKIFPHFGIDLKAERDEAAKEAVGISVEEPKENMTREDDDDEGLEDQSEVYGDYGDEDSSDEDEEEAWSDDGIIYEGDAE